jgi:ribonuclease-3 family protein
MSETPVTTNQSDLPVQQATVSLQALAHLGDAVYGLWVKAWAVQSLGHPKAHALHQFTSKACSATVQARFLQQILPSLTPDELDWVRRGRNLRLSTSRRSAPGLYHQATALEVVLGWLYLNDSVRLLALKQQLFEGFISQANHKEDPDELACQTENL